MHSDKERQHMRRLNHDHEGDKAMSPHDRHGHALAGRDLGDSFSRGFQRAAQRDIAPDHQPPRSRRVRPPRPAGPQADRRHDDSDARLRRLDPRPDTARRSELGGDGRLHERDGPGDDRALARAQGRRPIRRRAGRCPLRHAAAHRTGGRFSYRLRFPDPGVYWYHPHIREDYTQEMGLLRKYRRRAKRP